MYSSYDAVQVLSLRGVVDFYIEDCSTRVCLLIRFLLMKVWALLSHPFRFTDIFALEISGRHPYDVCCIFSAILSDLRALPDGALNCVLDDLGIGPIHAAIGYHCEDSSVKILEFMFCFGLDVNMR